MSVCFCLISKGYYSKLTKSIYAELEFILMKKRPKFLKIAVIELYSTDV